MLTLIASFFWGSVGLAFVVYGKKAGELVPAGIGIALMVLSYFLSALWLTLVAVLLLGAFWMYHKGYL